jgi:hypothetical protein
MVGSLKTTPYPGPDLQQDDAIDANTAAADPQQIRTAPVA